MLDAQVLTGSRWELLEYLAKQPKSTSELAKLLGTSQANVSQQLKQLELAGFVTRERSTKPNTHYHYRIHSSLIHMVLVSPRAVYKKQWRQDKLLHFYQSLLLTDDGETLLTFLLSRPELASRFIAIGVLQRNDPQLFVIAENVDDIRQHHANIMVKTRTGEHKVVLWSHTKQEIINGLEHQDPYFLSTLKEVGLMHDPEHVLIKLREKLEEMQ